MVPSVAKLGFVPGWAILWLVFLSAAGVFAYRATFLVRLLKLGRAENRFDRIGERLGRLLTYVFAQRRLVDEPLVGVPHVLIFYGFLVFLMATSGMLLQGLLPGWQIPTVDQNRYLAPLVDVFAVLVLGGLAVSSFRRFVIRPAGLQLTRDATLVNLLIASLMVTYLLAEGFRGVARPEATTVWLPVGSWLAGALATSAPLAAGAVFF